jgi:Ca2+-binding RTX toxin-like protein
MLNIHRASRMSRRSKRLAAGAPAPGISRRIFDVEWLETRNLLTAFTFVSSFSTVAVNGSIDGAPVTAQYAGGLSDTYTGAVQANIVGSNLTIESGSTATANSSGMALPGSSAANYAGVYDGINFAVRNLAFGLSGSITLGGGGLFTANGTATATSGEVDLDILGNTVSEPITGSVAGNVDVTGNGSVRTADGSTSITLPIHEVLDKTIDGVQFDLNLDGQVLLSGTPAETAVLSGSTLVVTGTPTSDILSITNSDGEIKVVEQDESEQDFPAGEVSEVSVLGGLGPDSISIGAGVPTAIVIGGLGADSISAANAANDILAGSGAGDQINATGSSGNDLIKGGYGPDSLTVDTGTGNDTLIGGVGFDELTGGTGENLLAGGPGGDTIIGGTGHETLDGGVGTNQIMPGVNDSVIS